MSMMTKSRGGGGVSVKNNVLPKVCLLYDNVLKNDSITHKHEFWHEFFLLWAHPERISESICRLSSSQLLACKPILNHWSSRCVTTVLTDSGIRAVNALQTLIGLIRGICGQPPRAFGVDRVDILFGHHNVEQTMQSLLTRLCEFLTNTGAHPRIFNRLSLILLLTMVTCCDDLNSSALVQYVLVSDVFESSVQLLANASLRSLYGRDVVLLLSLLVNYRKHDNVNPVTAQLSILDDELALHGYSQSISAELAEYNSNFHKQVSASDSTGVMSGFSNWLGGLFVTEQVSLHNVKTDETLLLAMYEAVHLNRNFITTLTSLSATSAATTTVDQSTTDEHQQQQQHHTTATTTTTTTVQSAAVSSVAVHRTISSDSNADSSPSGPPTPTPTAFKQPILPSSSQHPPVNLLSAFLTYCSVVLHDLKSDRSKEAAKLCAIILTCVAEDQYANTLMHDVNMSFRVPLYRIPMLHRGGAFDKTPRLWPLACTVLELAREFITSHLMKSLPFEMHVWMLSIVHKILCYQKRFRVRLHYTWREFWNALFSLLRYTINHEAVFIMEFDLFVLYQKVVTLLNLFITFGDTFLPAALTYDHLYYEVVRQSTMFDNLYSLAVRYAQNSANAKYCGAAQRLCNHLVNIRAIVQHFRVKLDHLPVTVTEDEVIDVIRANYDSLSLKLHENLDVFERYNEKPTQTEFFKSQVCRIMHHTRQSLSVELRQMDPKSVVEQISMFKAIELADHSDQSIG